MSIGRTILDCKLALCHLASDMKYAGAVYEARTYGSVRGMRRKPHPTRYARLIRLIGLVDFLSYVISVIIHYEFKHRYFVVGVKLP